MVPYRQEVGAEGHQRQAGEEVLRPTRRMEEVRQPCFCVVVRMKAEVPAVLLAVEGPHLQRVDPGRKGLPATHSQGTFGCSIGCSLLQEGTAR